MWSVNSKLINHVLQLNTYIHVHSLHISWRHFYCRSDWFSQYYALNDTIKFFFECQQVTTGLIILYRKWDWRSNKIYYFKNPFIKLVTFLNWYRKKYNLICKTEIVSQIILPLSKLCLKFHYRGIFADIVYIFAHLHRALHTEWNMCKIYM